MFRGLFREQKAEPRSAGRARSRELEHGRRVEEFVTGDGVDVAHVPLDEGDEVRVHGRLLRGVRDETLGDVEAEPADAALRETDLFSVDLSW